MTAKLLSSALVLALLVNLTHAAVLSGDNIFYMNCSTSTECAAAKYCNTIKLDGTLGVCEEEDVKQCFCASRKECKSGADCVGDNQRCARYARGAAKYYCVPCEGNAYGYLKPIAIDGNHTCNIVFDSGETPIGAPQQHASDNASSAASGFNSADPAKGAPDDSGVCVDARALAHLPREELVFREHRSARVLCDATGSCATPGHMVVFHGRPLTMLEYCAAAAHAAADGGAAGAAVAPTVGGCSEATMAVNSVRYARGARVASATTGLEYTAFAARFETRAEGVVLKAAVRSGL